jgi:hypothetical protein
VNPAEVQPRARRKPRLGWLGPALLAVGIAAGSVGAYVLATSRPTPGAVVDVIAIDAEFAILIRGEHGGGTRNFLQLVHVRRGTEWTAMIPRYAGAPGRPAVGWAANAISVRIERAGGPELWSFSTIDASKLGQPSLTEYALGTPVHGASKVTTATDGTRSFEVIDGAEGTRLVAFDLSRGAHLWTRDLDRRPIQAIEVHAGGMKVTTPDGETAWIDARTGADAAAPEVASYGPALRSPAAWLLTGDTLEVRDTQSGQIVARLAID